MRRIRMMASMAERSKEEEGRQKERRRKWEL